jgi:hypothetical protein
MRPTARRSAFTAGEPYSFTQTWRRGRSSAGGGILYASRMHAFASPKPHLP